MFFLLPSIFFISFFGCVNPPEPVLTKSESDTMQVVSFPQTYLALGDSYTIGQNVPESSRWPVQLRDSLVALGIELQKPEIVARTGWTTDELIEAIRKTPLADTFGMVSLLIGVNNQYRGYPIAKYETEFGRLLDTALGFAGEDLNCVLCCLYQTMELRRLRQAGIPPKSQKR